MAYIRALRAFQQREIGFSERSLSTLATDANDELYGSVYQDVYAFGRATPSGETRFTGLFGRDLSVDRSEKLTGGTVQMIGDTEISSGVLRDAWYISRLHVDAREFGAVGETAGIADDKQLIARILGGNDRFSLSRFDDLASGYRGNDVMRGGIGDDTLLGAAGNDRLHGAQGDDRLEGGQGNDRLEGAGDSDVLLGNAGHDVLIGGAGADRFVFRQVEDSNTIRAKSDLIEDFDQRYDVIDLRAIDASTEWVGNNRFRFVGEDAIGTRAMGEVSFRQFDQPGDGIDITVIRIDTDGDTAAEAMIRLRGVYDLSADDFML